MAVKFTAKQWARMVSELEKKYAEPCDAETSVDVTSILDLIKTRGTASGRRCCADGEEKPKRVANAYIRFVHDKEIRAKIIAEHFDGEASTKASQVTKKGSEIWNQMSDSDKKPYKDAVESAKAEAGQRSATPKSPWNPVAEPDHEAPDGWSGPFKGKFLRKYCVNADNSRPRYETFEEAVKHAEELGGECGGITLEKGNNGRSAYTLRVKNDPETHEKPDSRTYSLASWTKTDFEPTVVEKAKKPRAKKSAKKTDVETPVESEGTAAPEPVENNSIAETENEGDSSDEDETDDEEEELAVKIWEHNGEKYLLDESTGDVYDHESQELIGKKGEGKFAVKKLSVKKN